MNWNPPSKLPVARDYSSLSRFPGPRIKCVRRLSKCSNFKSRYSIHDSSFLLSSIEFKREYFESVFRNKTNCDFYLIRNDSLIEIIGSNIVMAYDNEFRKTPSQGYFIVGKLLNDKIIQLIIKW